jgi:hypothetical protein
LRRRMPVHFLARGFCRQQRLDMLRLLVQRNRPTISECTPRTRSTWRPKPGCGRRPSWSTPDARNPWYIALPGSTNIGDVQRMINEALGVMPASNDLNGDGMAGVVEVQIVIHATLGLGCTASWLLSQNSRCGEATAPLRSRLP